MAKKKVHLRMRSYLMVRDKLEEGLGFALNRLEDVCGFKITDEQRSSALEPMLSELTCALEEVVDWEKSE
jgi:hypothetical protein